MSPTKRQSKNETSQLTEDEASSPSLESMQGQTQEELDKERQAQVEKVEKANEEARLEQLEAEARAKLAEAAGRPLDEDEIAAQPGAVVVSASNPAELAQRMKARSGGSMPIRYPVTFQMRGSKQNVLRSLGLFVDAFAERHGAAPRVEAAMPLFESAGYQLEGLELADNEQARVDIRIDKNEGLVSVSSLVVTLPRGVETVAQLEELERKQREG